MEYIKGLVSVIVPVYNVEKDLALCVKSLVEQTYSNIEILLIDDCSKDKSLEECYRLAKTDQQIKVFKNEQNSGQAVARNKGLDNASGQWIMFLDSDDTFTPDAVETMLDFARENNTEVVFSSYTYIQRNTPRIAAATLSDGKYARSDFVAECLTNINWAVMCCIGSKIYNKEFLDKNQIRFDPSYKYNEDGAFMLTALSKAENVGYLDKPFYQYYIRESGSTMSSHKENMFSYINKTNMLLKQVLEENNAFSGEQKKLWMQKQMSFYIACMANDARFKSYSVFKENYKYIKNDEFFDEIIRACAVSGFMKKSIKCFMKLNLTLPIYILLKLYYTIK